MMRQFRFFNLFTKRQVFCRAGYVTELRLIGMKMTRPKTKHFVSSIAAVVDTSTQTLHSNASTGACSATNKVTLPMVGMKNLKIVCLCAQISRNSKVTWSTFRQLNLNVFERSVSLNDCKQQIDAEVKENQFSKKYLDLEFCNFWFFRGIFATELKMNQFSAAMRNQKYAGIFVPVTVTFRFQTQISVFALHPCATV
jgi:hypothetical protein